MMNILISVTDLCVGGGQNFAVKLAKALAKNHFVVIFNYETFEKKCQSLFIGDLLPTLKIISLPSQIYWFAKAIDAILLKLGIKPSVWQMIQKNYLRSLITSHKIDVVNSHLYGSDHFVVDTLRDSKTPIVISDHGDYRYIIEQGLSKIEEIHKIFGRVDAIAYPSYSNAQAASKYTQEFQVLEEVIYYGMPTESLKSHSKAAREKLTIPENALVFGIVARGIPSKGWAEAIEAFKLAQASSEKEMHLILVGGGDYLSSLEQSLDPQVTSYVHFVGYSSEPNYWIESFDVGLLPTCFPGESLPNSVIEYLALGKPVIATSVGGIPEMLTYDKQQAGFIVSLNQDGKADVSLLANAMIAYANNSNLFEDHKILAKNAFEKFNMQTCVKAYEQLFQRVLSQASELPHK